MISRNQKQQGSIDGEGETGASDPEMADPEYSDQQSQPADLSAGPSKTGSSDGSAFRSSEGANDRSTERVDSGRISDFLRPSGIVLDLDTSSRKRLFEALSELAASGLDEISENDVFKIFTERERLGCTGLGHGIAVPHGRIENLAQPVISMARLKHPIDYDAPDDRPVWLAVSLLVPANANDTHLKLLSKLAGCFQDDAFVSGLKSCTSADSVIGLFDERE